MAASVTQFKLGSYYTYPTEDSAVLGQMHVENNTNIGDEGAQQPSTYNSGSMIKCMLVVNNSGGALTPGYAGKLSVATDGFTGLHEVTGVETTAIGNIAVLIDPFITGTIPDGALFNVVLCGAVPFIAGAALSKGTTIIPGSGGKWVATAAGTPGTTFSTYPYAYGKVITATAADGDEGKAIFYPKLLA